MNLRAFVVMQELLQPTTSRPCLRLCHRRSSPCARHSRSAGQRQPPASRRRSRGSLWPSSTLTLSARKRLPVARWSASWRQPEALRARLHCASSPSGSWLRREKSLHLQLCAQCSLRSLATFSAAAVFLLLRRPWERYEPPFNACLCGASLDRRSHAFCKFL